MRHTDNDGGDAAEIADTLNMLEARAGRLANGHKGVNANNLLTYAFSKEIRKIHLAAERIRARRQEWSSTLAMLNLVVRVRAFHCEACNASIERTGAAFEAGMLPDEAVFMNEHLDHGVNVIGTAAELSVTIKIPMGKNALEAIREAIDN
jgi:hypothetical protein